MCCVPESIFTELLLHNTIQSTAMLYLSRGGRGSMTVVLITLEDSKSALTKQCQRLKRHTAQSMVLAHQPPLDEGLGRQMR